MSVDDKFVTECLTKIDQIVKISRNALLLTTPIVDNPEPRTTAVIFWEFLTTTFQNFQKYLSLSKNFKKNILYKNFKKIKKNECGW